MAGKSYGKRGMPKFKPFSPWKVNQNTKPAQVKMSSTLKRPVGDSSTDLRQQTTTQNFSFSNTAQNF
jgi:hypothetical protein